MVNTINKDKKPKFFIGVTVCFYVSWIFITLFVQFINEELFNAINNPLFSLILIVSIVGLFSLMITILKNTFISYYLAILSLVSITGFLIIIMIQGNYLFYNYLWFVFSVISIMNLLFYDVRSYLLTDGKHTILEDKNNMFSYKEYHLFAKDIQLKGSNKTQRIYFFSKKENTSGFRCPLPKGYFVSENRRTGLPFLKKQK